MITYAQIAAAARALDGRSDRHGVSVQLILGDDLGCDPAGAQEAADQRGLRAVLVFGGRELPRASEPVAVNLSETERRMLARYAAVWLDGFAIGLKVGQS